MNDVSVTEDMERSDNAISVEKKKNEVICFSDVEEKVIVWLWFPFIPKGKITIIQGDPGSGKTYLTTYIASIVSNGGKFPDSDENIDPGNVILQNGEDDVNDTLKPRLNKVNANCDNVYIIDESSDKAFNLKDVKRFRSILEEKKPALVIIDPIQQYIGDIDTSAANKVRNVLAPIKRLAEEFNCAVLIVMHMNKGSNKALYKALGSIDFVGIARSMLTVGVNPKDPNEKIMSHTKSSNGELGTSLAFAITDDGIEWLGERDLSSDDIITAESKKPRQEAKDFIKDMLSQGINSAKEITIRAKKMGINKETLNRAKRQLNIKSIQKADGWYWELPSE